MDRLELVVAAAGEADPMDMIRISSPRPTGAPTLMKTIRWQALNHG
jgi:hypothetical protein